MYESTLTNLIYDKLMENCDEEHEMLDIDPVFNSWSTDVNHFVLIYFKGDGGVRCFDKYVKLAETLKESKKTAEKFIESGLPKQCEDCINAKSCDAIPAAYLCTCLIK